MNIEQSSKSCFTRTYLSQDGTKAPPNTPVAESPICKLLERLKREDMVAYASIKALDGERFVYPMGHFKR